MEKDPCRWVVYLTVLCDYPYIVALLLAVVLSLHFCYYLYCSPLHEQIKMCHLYSILEFIQLKSGNQVVLLLYKLVLPSCSGVLLCCSGESVGFHSG